MAIGRLLLPAALLLAALGPAQAMWRTTHSMEQWAGLSDSVVYCDEEKIALQIQYYNVKGEVVDKPDPGGSSQKCTVVTCRVRKWFKGPVVAGDEITVTYDVNLVRVRYDDEEEGHSEKRLEAGRALLFLQATKDLKKYCVLDARLVLQDHVFGFKEFDNPGALYLVEQKHAENITLPKDGAYGEAELLGDLRPAMEKAAASPDPSLPLTRDGAITPFHEGGHPLIWRSQPMKTIALLFLLLLGPATLARAVWFPDYDMQRLAKMSDSVVYCDEKKIEHQEITPGFSDGARTIATCSVRNSLQGTFKSGDEIVVTYETWVVRCLSGEDTHWLVDTTTMAKTFYPAKYQPPGRSLLFLKAGKNPGEYKVVGARTVLDGHVFLYTQDMNPGHQLLHELKRAENLHGYWNYGESELLEDAQIAVKKARKKKRNRAEHEESGLFNFVVHRFNDDRPGVSDRWSYHGRLGRFVRERGLLRRGEGRVKSNSA